MEGWPAQCRELELELERLVGWKHDVLNQEVDAMFKDSSPLHTMIRRSLVNIAQILVGCKSSAGCVYSNILIANPIGIAPKTYF